MSIFNEIIAGKEPTLVAVLTIRKALSCFYWKAGQGAVRRMNLTDPIFAKQVLNRSHIENIIA